MSKLARIVLLPVLTLGLASLLGGCVDDGDGYGYGGGYRNEYGYGYGYGQRYAAPSYRPATTYYAGGNRYRHEHYHRDHDRW